MEKHLMALNGDQLDPAYVKLNPNGVVPTLVHEGNVPSYETAITKWLRPDDIARYEKTAGSWDDVRKNLRDAV